MSPDRARGAGARPNALTYIVLGLSDLTAAFNGGVLVPCPDIVIAIPSDPVGQLWLDLQPPGGYPAYSLWWQLRVKDPDGPNGWAASNALRADVPSF